MRRRRCPVALFAMGTLTAVVLMTSACSESMLEPKSERQLMLTPSGVAQISSGQGSVCGLDPVGTVKCWGAYGNAPAGTYVQVSAGRFHACAIRTDEALICWGSDPIGYGTLNVPTGSFTEVSAGNLHSCALRTDGTVVCWGSNDYGQGGVPPGVFTQVSTHTFHACGLRPDGTIECWGGGFFDIGSSRAGTFTQVRAGADHTCAMRPDNTLLCWGNGHVSPPGMFASVSGGGGHDCGMRTDGTPVCFDAAGNSMTIPNEPFVQMAAGYGHSCGLKADLTIICWGGLNLTVQLVPPPGATAPGSNVSVVPNDQTTGQPAPVSLTFGSVTGAGITSVTSSMVGGGGSPPAPSGFRLGNPATYYNVTTTASYAGQINICFDYSSISYSNENNLKLLHYENGAWVNITAPGYPNTATNTICGITTSLSPFLVAQLNSAPAVTSIQLPAAPVRLGSSVAITANLSDADAADTHTATVDWGDGSQSAGAVNEAGGAGTVDAAHTYVQPGVYVVTANVSDGLATGGRSSADETTTTYIVVYDATAGFVVGGGWILSPESACQVVSLCGSTTADRATFGFVSKYNKGATAPSGNTEFQYHAGKFSFKSSSYDWLVIAGARAQFKGTGSINGAGEYGFLLTAVDGEVNGGGGIDRFRIKIWDKSSGDVIYDNNGGQADDSTPSTTLGGGSIKIQK